MATASAGDPNYLEITYAYWLDIPASRKHVAEPVSANDDDSINADA